jgi:uncharacterized repeat protein (TIGR02543 family)
MLYACWTPQTVNYTLVYWVEKPNFSGDPGTNEDNYIFYKAQTRQALAGSNVSHTSATGLDRIEVVANPAIANSTKEWATFGFGESATVMGNGTTVINVYFKRIVFTYQFNLSPTNTGDTCTMQFMNPSNGQLYGPVYSHTGGQNPIQTYSISAKYEQDIEAIWPSSWNASFGNSAQTFNKFAYWNTDSIYASASYVSKRFTVTPDMLPRAGNAASFRAVWGNTILCQLDYWLQRLPEESGGTVKTFNGVSRTFLLSSKHSQQILVSTLVNGKTIEGMTLVGTIYLDANRNETTRLQDIVYYTFYYSRNVYTLSFNTMGGNNIAPVPNVMFGADLSYNNLYMPTNPTKRVDGVDYIFQGWFLDADYHTPFDPHMTMPNNDLTLFARWQSTAYEVRFYDDLTTSTLVGTVYKGYGEYLLPSETPYTVGNSYTNKGVFEGWYIFIAGTNQLMRFSYETPIIRDMNLHAGWIIDGFTVTYDLAGGTGTTPIDNNKYSLGRQTRVASGSGIIPPAGKVLVGWDEVNTGQFYYPGMYATLSGNARFVAHYGNTDDYTQLVYHANYPDGTDATITWSVPKNRNISLAGANMFSYPPFSITGWGTAAGLNNAIVYTLGADMPVGSTPVDLYAVWNFPGWTVSFGAGDHGSFNSGAVTSFSGIYDKIAWSTYFDGVTRSVPIPVADLGYAFDGWLPVFPTTITQNQTFVAQYKFDDSQTHDISYRVEYFLNGTIDNAKTDIVKETVHVSVWTLTVIKADINLVDAFGVGYRLSNTIPATIPDTISDGGVIRVYYVDDPSQTKELSYTVEYYKDNVRDDALTQTVIKTVWVNSPTLPVDIADINMTNAFGQGYKFERTDPAVIPGNIPGDSVIKVYYITDTTATKPLSYTVEYYKENVIDSSLTQTVTKQVWINDTTLPVDVADINVTNAFGAGYKFSHTIPAPIPTNITGGSVIRVYYIVDPDATKPLSYTVEYYKENVIDSSLTQTVTKQVWVNDTTLPVDVADINVTNAFGVGYKFDRTDPTPIPTTILGGSVIKVYYVIDDTQTKELSYTVMYYLNGTPDNTKTQTVTATVWVNATMLPVNIAAINVTNAFGVGYKFNYTDPTPLPTEILGGSVIRVYYVDDFDQTKDISYSVEYYLNNAIDNTKTQTFSATVWINAVTMPVNVAAINVTNAFGAGYKFDRTDPATIPLNIADNGVIKVYYITDTDQTKELSYTVEYYLNGTPDATKTQVVVATVWINATMLPVNIAAINVTNAFGVGYKFDRTDPTPLPTETPGGSVIKVYYVDDFDQTKELSYTVEYYLNNVLDDTKTQTVTQTVWVNATTLPVNIAAINVTNAFGVGYVFNYTNPMPIPANITGGSVIKVYYISDFTQTKDITYTVEYYLNNTIDNTKTQTVTQTVWVNTPNIPVNIAAINRIDAFGVGYKFDRTDPATIPANIADGGVIKVYYVDDLDQTKDISYRVEYYVDGLMDPAKTQIVSDTVWVNAPAVLTVNTAAINTTNAFGIGYKFDRTDPATIPTTANDGDVIKVYYLTDLDQRHFLDYYVEYYLDNVHDASLDQTITESVWINDNYLLFVVQSVNTTNAFGVGCEFIRTDPDPIPWMIPADTVIKVYYEATFQTLTYNGNGATAGSMPDEQHRVGEVFNLTANAYSRAGYSFAGWATSATGTVVYANSASFTMPANNVTLFAVWTANTDTPYTVEHRNIEDDSILETETFTGTTGTTVTASPIFIFGYVQTTDPREVLTGTIAGDGSLVLKVYYAVDVVVESWPPNPGFTLTAGYTVEHYDASSGALLAADSLSAVVGASVAASPKAIAGYAYVPTDPRQAASGTVASGGGLVLKLYYSPLTGGIAPLGQSRQVIAASLAPDSPVPLASTRPLALINLLLTIGGIFMAITLFAIYFARQRKTASTGASLLSQLDSRMVWRVANAAAALVALTVFILTEARTTGITLVDVWTIPHIVIFGSQIAVSILAARKAEEEEDTPATEGMSAL